MAAALGQRCSGVDGSRRRRDSGAVVSMALAGEGTAVQWCGWLSQAKGQRCSGVDGSRRRRDMRCAMALSLMAGSLYAVTLGRSISPPVKAEEGKK